MAANQLHLFNIIHQVSLLPLGVSTATRCQHKCS